MIFWWLIGQCNETETKEEYDRSHDELDKFVEMNETKAVLSIDCINAIKSLQKKLRSKEYKLAFYRRFSIKNCLDAMTTSSVEGNN